MFTLKVFHNKTAGSYTPNDIHMFGGIDVVQTYAFRHLFPADYCGFMAEDILFSLAEAHGWKVEVTEKKEK